MAPERNLAHLHQYSRQKRIRDMGKTKRQRICSRHQRGLIDGAFDGQCIRPRAKAEPRAGMHRKPNHIIGRAGPAQDVRRGHSTSDTSVTGKHVGSTLHPRRHDGGGEHDVGTHLRMVPVDDPAFGNPRPDSVRGWRAVEARRVLLRAGPLHLEGFLPQGSALPPPPRPCRSSCRRRPRRSGRSAP